jgi:hypothetical protein
LREVRNNVEALRLADDAVRTLSLYSQVLNDPIGQTYVEIVDLLTPHSHDLSTNGDPRNESHGKASPQWLAVLYRKLFALLAQEAEFSPSAGVGDAWQNHLLDRVLQDENPFSLKAHDGGLEQIGEVVKQAVRADLAELQHLYEFNGTQLREAILRRDPDARNLPPFEGFAAPNPSSPNVDREMKEQFAGAARWSDLLPALAEYIHQRGLGIFRDYRAFRWESAPGGGRLAGIAEPDDVHLDDLIGYENERLLLLQNTDHFVAGFAANNVLLYGDRGTGKSSTVKALLHNYGDRGLRMVEVQKEHLDDFPAIIRLLRGRRERFILFIDDLSFEENETHYKDLKALLEGSLEAKPDNILLYATSNRRHLIKERFSDRIHKLEDDEIHLNDTTEEKLSLSDRFGLTLTFLAPTQARYLAIVDGMAQRRGVEMLTEELHGRALAWATQRGGRSGRVAKQFMDHLVAELQYRQVL